MRQRRKPSDTVCPAMVAIMEELCPDASKARANNVAGPEYQQRVNNVFRDISVEVATYLFLRRSSGGREHRTS